VSFLQSLFYRFIALSFSILANPIEDKSSTLPILMPDGVASDVGLPIIQETLSMRCLG
jgi:hypothetical protein